MKEHRARIINLDGETFNFVEMEPDIWLCVERLPTHKAIHEFIEKERKSNIRHLRVSSRAFDIDSRFMTYVELKQIGD